MGIAVRGIKALRVLELLRKMDVGYVPTEEEWAYLSEIKFLNLSKTQISTLPESIGNLSHLWSLDLSGTPISTLPESIGNLSNLQALYLSETQIRTLPDSIGNLTNLQVLYLYNTQIRTLPESIGNLTNLQALSLYNTQIRTLPDSIGSLSNLQELKLSYTRISVFPEAIENLTNLQELDLSSTHISTLPKFIGELSNLLSHIPFYGQISTLPDFIGSLSNLQKLDLSNTPISVFPEAIGNLTNLQELDLSWTRISALPECIGNLSNLQKLDLSNTPISTLPESIGNLSKLQEFDLSWTQIRTLPDSIDSLSNLQSLHLSGAPISTLPDSIGSLSNLQSLHLSGVPISTLPDSIGNLTSLKRLNLSRLHLQQIPRSLFELGLDFCFEYSSDGINLSGTTLATQPISLFHQPREFIAAYYESLEATADAPASKIKIYDAKVIFLGDGGVGKTRTIKRLLNGGEPGDYPTELTPGIEITDYSTTYSDHPVDIRFWDFGGQEIMHAMHRCFLTDRTCYVVMVSNRFGNRTQRARYWLKTIDSFAKNCPVILAVNLWDTDEGISGVNGELLAEEFDNLKKIITYSAKGSDKDHFNRLTEAIVEQANRLDSCGMEFPESWANIRADLSKRAEKDRYISKAEYLEICEKNGETDPQICGWLLEWFNDLGVCFSYHTDKESGQELENYQVLDPRWLVNAVYLIINKGGNYAQQSSLPLKGIWDILTTGGGTSADAKYEESECEYILEVMRKFHLSYPNNEESEFIPALCLDEWKTTPQTEGWDSHVTYEMEYGYLPDSVLHQLMISCKAERLLVQAWSGGMELSADRNKLHAVIYLRAEKSKLEINAYAKDGQKPWVLLDDLRKKLYDINKSLGLQEEAIKDYIVIQKNQQTAHFPVASVVQAVERHIPTLYAMDDGKLEEYRVNDILGAAFDMEKVEKEQKNARERKTHMEVNNINGVNGMNGWTVHGNVTINIGTDEEKDSETPKELLQQFLTYLERRDEKAEALLTEALAALRESREPEVQKLVAEIDDTAKKKGRLQSAISAVEKVLKSGANAAAIAAALAPLLPGL